MPTVPTKSPKASKPRAKATAKRTSAKASARAKATSARTSRVSARGTTKLKASHAKGARTRAAHQAEATLRQTQTATKETAGVFGDYAERAVLIPVGAALIARDRVVTSVSDTVSTYSSTSKAQAQLRRFEHRGITARNRLEREVRKARVRVERELRQRRRVLESAVSDLEDRRDAITKNGSDIANRVPELVDRVQERVLSLV